MSKDQCIKPTDGEAIGDVLARLMAKVRKAPPEPRTDPPTDPKTDDGAGTGRPFADRTAVYDFDLAEFPLFSFAKRPTRDRTTPLVYTDTIRGKDGRPVSRTWTASPGRLGLGGATAHALLFDLLQLYAEQGGRASVVHFGTLRSLYLRRGERNPSKADYERLRRDFAVLRGYDFSCRNACWDSTRRAYVSMDWRLFGAVYYFKTAPQGGAEQPHGFIELSPTFRATLQTRGLFRLGYDAGLFHRLPPLAQRLSLYLAKMFTYQVVHNRRVDDLSRLLPIETRTPADARKVLARTIGRLQELAPSVLADFACAPKSDRTWWAVFRRGAAASRIPRRTNLIADSRLGPLATQVERILEAVGGSDRVWWEHCVRRLGASPIDRALGQLRETRQTSRVRNPGGLLTKILKDISAEAGVRLTVHGHAE